jgi:hypothetical protein
MINNRKYLVKWEADKPWIFWDGVLKDGQSPPLRVKILSTQLEYDWESFNKVRNGKKRSN